jgi:transketolase
MELVAAYRAKYPELATEIDQMQRRELPKGWDRDLPMFPADPKGVAGRDASGKVLNVLAQSIPLPGASRTPGACRRRHQAAGGKSGAMVLQKRIPRTGTRCRQ